MRIQKFPLSEVERMIREGEIKDATTVAALGLLRLEALPVEPPDRVVRRSLALFGDHISKEWAIFLQRKVGQRNRGC